MTKHLFCLEGEYENSLRDRTSVLPLLEYLETALGLEYIYRRTATPEEFFFFLEKSCRKNYQDYRLLYLAFHGEANYIYTSAQQWVSLEEIAACDESQRASLLQPVDSLLQGLPRVDLDEPSAIGGHVGKVK